MYASVIVGGGPGGLGPLIAASQKGDLPELLASGVAVVDRQESLGGTLGRYAINSDTLGGAYLEFLEAPCLPPALKILREDPLTRQIDAYRDRFPPLGLVHRFMHRIGAQFETLLAENGRCAFHRSTDAKALHLCADGSVRLEIVGPDGKQAWVSARSAVVALGGQPHSRQRYLLEDLQLEDCALSHLMTSDEFMTEDGTRTALELLHREPVRPMVILGGSHSAYAAAGVIASLLPSELAPWARVIILQRRQPPVFYPSVAAASDDGYSVEPGDVCPRTQRVHRLGGLRGDGREMWRRIHGRPGIPAETRVSCHALGDYSRPGLQALIESACLVVTAFGYAARTLAVFDAGGRAVQLQKGGSMVNDQCQVMLADGSPLPNVFGIGLGSGYRPQGSMGGEPNFRGQANSLWLYQNDIGALVYRGIHAASRAGIPLSHLQPVSGSREAPLVA